MKEISLRDIRQSKFFWIDNDVFDNYFPTLGYHCLAVYASLARYAINDNGKATVSLSYMAKKLKTSKERVIESISDLEKCGLIKKETGKPHNNVPNSYLMLTPEPGSTLEPQKEQPGSTSEPGVVLPQNRAGSTVEPPNNTNNTRKKESEAQGILPAMEKIWTGSRMFNKSLPKWKRDLPSDPFMGMAETMGREKFLSEFEDYSSEGVRFESVGNYTQPHPFDFLKKMESKFGHAKKNGKQKVSAEESAKYLAKRFAEHQAYEARVQATET